MEKLTLSVVELGKMLGIGRNGAYALVKRSDFPAINIGKRIIIPVDGLRAWLAREGGVELTERGDNDLG